MGDELRERIAEFVRRGEQLETIEAELLSPRPGLDDDERAALWLYAWLQSEAPAGRVRRRPPRAVEYIHD